MYYVASIAILITMALALARAVLGPSVYDRVLAVNMLGTKIVLLLSVMGAFSEFERALIKERQKEGIALAKKRGAYRGRKKTLSEDKIHEIKNLVESGIKKTLIAKDMGISRETLYQYLKKK